MNEPQEDKNALVEKQEKIQQPAEAVESTWINEIRKGNYYLEDDDGEE